MVPAGVTASSMHKPNPTETVNGTISYGTADVTATLNSTVPVECSFTVNGSCTNGTATQSFPGIILSVPANTFSSTGNVTVPNGYHISCLEKDARSLGSTISTSFTYNGTDYTVVLTILGTTCGGGAQ